MLDLSSTDLPGNCPLCHNPFSFKALIHADCGGCKYSLTVNRSSTTVDTPGAMICFVKGNIKVCIFLGGSKMEYYTIPGSILSKEELKRIEKICLLC